MKASGISQSPICSSSTHLTHPRGLLLPNPKTFLLGSPSPNPLRFISIPPLRCSSPSLKPSDSTSPISTLDELDAWDNLQGEPRKNEWNVEVGRPPIFQFSNYSFSDQAFLLLTFIAFTTSVALTSFVIAAAPTLHALARAANAFTKLADTARLELPGTMAAVRLSSMEISDLTLELRDLSHEVADGVQKSAKAVQAVDAGIRQTGARARELTICMIRERANLPVISLQPVVVGAAKKTSGAVGRAARTIMSIIISRRRNLEEDKDD